MNKGLGDLGGAMDGEITEVNFGFEIVQGPAGHVTRFELMARVRSDGGVTEVHRVPGGVLDGADKPAPATHDKPLVPRIGK